MRMNCPTCNKNVAEALKKTEEIKICKHCGCKFKLNKGIKTTAMPVVLLALAGATLATFFNNCILAIIILVFGLGFRYQHIYKIEVITSGKAS
jgi:hypothetical protein